MLLYKFVSEKEENSHAVLQSCIEGNLMFSRIPDLNDPSEKFTSVDDEEINSSLDRILREGCQEKEMANLQCQVNLMGKVFPEMRDKLNMVFPLLSMLRQVTREEINPLVRELPNLLQSINKKIQEKTGIFSAILTFDSFPMWSHYGKDATGFVIEYEDLDKYFTGDNTGVFDKVKPIVYIKNKRSAVPFSPSGLNELFFNKLADWGYENEYRVVKSLSDCIKDKNGKYFAEEKYKQCVKRIIVGWNNQHFDEMKEIVSKFDKCISVVKANPNKDPNHIVAE